jgi:undecaprenyl-diphosphatase
VRRKRPEGEWGRIYRFTDPHSFPSGHAARAFLIATVATALGPAWLAIALWIWAPLVALARVAMGVHYLSDIVAGALFGILVASIGLLIYQPLFQWVFSVFGFSLW